VYEVYLEGVAERDSKRLSAEVFQRIIGIIKGLRENPGPSGCRKIIGSKNDWRIGMGSYRISYEIDDKTKTVKKYGASDTAERHIDKNIL
jgi:mRNA interferase RelE/StbE